MTEKAAKQHVVLCEGFDDRSFWSGWLKHLGCTDPSERGKKTVTDVWGRPVKGKGRYLFRTLAGSDVVIHPFHGRSNAGSAVAEYLDGQVYAPDRMILNLDSDADNGSGSAEQAAQTIAEWHGGSAVAGDGSYQLDETRLVPVIWKCSDPHPTPGVPRKQTLERLIAASIQAAFPDRGPAVEEWLAAEPRGKTIPKSYGYSYLAKWYAEHGADDFLREIWRDESVALELRKRLEATGAWTIVEDLVAD